MEDYSSKPDYKFSSGIMDARDELKRIGGENPTPLIEKLLEKVEWVIASAKAGKPLPE